MAISLSRFGLGVFLVNVAALDCAIPQSHSGEASTEPPSYKEDTQESRNAEESEYASQRDEASIPGAAPPVPLPFEARPTAEAYDAVLAPCGTAEGVAPCRPLYPPWGDPEYYGLDYYGSSPAVDQEVVPDEIDGIPKRSPDITYKPTAWDGCRASERLQSGTAEGQDVGKADGEPQQESEPRWLGDSDPEDEIPECRQCGEQVSEGEHSTQCRMWGVKAHKRGARAWCRRYCEVCRSCREGKERRTKTSEKEEELPDDATENQETVPNPMLPGEKNPREPRRDDREEPLHETSGKGESSEDAETARRPHQGAEKQDSDQEEDADPGQSRTKEKKEDRKSVV